MSEFWLRGGPLFLACCLLSLRVEAAAIPVQLIAQADPGFDSSHRRLANGKYVVTATTDESHPDVPLLLIVLSEKDPVATAYDGYHDDTISGRIYSIRQGKPESQAIPFPVGPGLPGAKIEHRAYAVGSGGDAIMAIVSRESESEGSSYGETLLRRTGDHLGAIFSTTYRGSAGEGGGTEVKIDVATSPGVYSGFSDFQLHQTLTNCDPDAPSCSSTIKTIAYCWDGHDYGIADGSNCEVSTVKASSKLVEKGATHAPELAIDGVNETAWCKAAADAAKGAWLQLNLRTPTLLDEIRVMPGYGKSDSTWKNNDRIKSARVSLDGEPSQTVSFTDSLTLQDVGVSARHGPVSSIRLQIVDVIPGAKFHDACISKIALKVHPR